MRARGGVPLADNELDWAMLVSGASEWLIKWLAGKDVIFAGAISGPGGHWL